MATEILETKKWSFLTWCLFIAVGGVTGLVILTAIGMLKRWRRRRAGTEKATIDVPANTEVDLKINSSSSSAAAPQGLEAM